MSGPVLRVEGFAKLSKTLRQAEHDLDDLKDVNQRVSEIARDAIADEVPVGPTGRLRRSVRGNRAKSRATVTVGYASVPYGPPIHWGWPKRNIEPNKFGERGLEAAEPEIVRAYMDGIQEILDDVRGA